MDSRNSSLFFLLHIILPLVIRNYRRPLMVEEINRFPELYHYIPILLKDSLIVIGELIPFEDIHFELAVVIQYECCI